MKRARGISKGERHIRLPHWMLTSPAWRTLSPNGKAVLLHVWERHNGVNNGQIVYAVREAAEIGLSRPTAARALIEAIELGFLKVTRDSAFRIKTKEAREFALTAERVGDEPATKEFMRWSAPKFKTQSHQRDRQSHQRDCDPKNEPKNAVSVSPMRLSGTQNGLSQSHQRDTSSIPGEELARRVARGNGASFGEDARGRRIARHYPKSGG